MTMHGMVLNRKSRRTPAKWPLLVRLRQEAETVTAEGLDICALSFALELRRALPVDLSAIDLEYSLNVALRDFQTVEQLKQAVFA